MRCHQADTKSSRQFAGFNEPDHRDDTVLAMRRFSVAVPEVTGTTLGSGAAGSITDCAHWALQNAGVTQSGTRTGDPRKSWCLLRDPPEEALSRNLFFVTTFFVNTCDYSVSHYFAILG